MHGLRLCVVLFNAPIVTFYVTLFSFLVRLMSLCYNLKYFNFKVSRLCLLKWFITTQISKDCFRRQILKIFFLNIVLSQQSTCRYNNHSLLPLQCNHSKILFINCSNTNTQIYEPCNIANRSISFPEKMGGGKVLAMGLDEPNKYCLDPILVSGISRSIYEYLSVNPITKTNEWIQWQIQNS